MSAEVKVFDCLSVAGKLRTRTVLSLNGRSDGHRLLCWGESRLGLARAKSCQRGEGTQEVLRARQWHSGNATGST